MSVLQKSIVLTISKTPNNRERMKTQTINYEEESLNDFRTGKNFLILQVAET